jgi:hypothetical protein
MKEQDANTISLVDLARAGGIGPIKLGERLSNFANYVGPPIRWGDFADRQKLSCIMVFGDVEVGFEGRDGDAVVTWAKFWLHGFRRSVLKFARHEDGLETRIRNPFSERFPTYEEVSAKLERENIEFTQHFKEPVGDDTVAVMNFGDNLKFYFSLRDGARLTVVWLS